MTASAITTWPPSSAQAAWARCIAPATPRWAGTYTEGVAGQVMTRRAQMSHRCIASLGTLGTVIAIVSLTSVPVAGQAQPAAASPSTPPRTSEGRPDLGGVWDFRTVTPLERPSELAGKEFFTEEEAAVFARQRVRESNVDLNRVKNGYREESRQRHDRDRRSGIGLQQLLVGPGDHGRRNPANVADCGSAGWEDSCPHTGGAAAAGRPGSPEPTHCRRSGRPLLGGALHRET